MQFSNLYDTGMKTFEISAMQITNKASEISPQKASDIFKQINQNQSRLSLNSFN